MKWNRCPGWDDTETGYSQRNGEIPIDSVSLC